MATQFPRTDAPFPALRAAAAGPLGLLALALTVVSALASPAQALESKAQQACIKASHKGFVAIAAAEGKAAGLCIKAVSLGTATQPSVDACIAADAKLASAKTKAATAIQKACALAPDFGPSDTTGAVVVSAASGVRTTILKEILGSDIDAALATKAGDAAATSCQAAIVSAVDRCWKARVGTYAGCASVGLMTSIADVGGLVACRDGDPKGVVAKACVTDLQATIDKKCAGVALDTRLPGCKCRYTQDCIAVTVANDANSAIDAAANLPAAATVLPFLRRKQTFVGSPWISPAYGEFIASRMLGREPDAPLACPLAAVNVYTIQDPVADATYTATLIPVLANQHVRVLFSKVNPVDVTGSSPPELVQGSQALPLYGSAADFLHLSTRHEVFSLINLKHLEVGDTLNYGFETCLYNCDSLFAEAPVPNIVFQGRMLILHFTASRAALEGVVSDLATEAGLATGVHLAWVGRVVADYKLELVDGSVVQTFHALPANGTVAYEIDAGVNPATDVLTLPALSSFLASATNAAVMVVP